MTSSDEIGGDAADACPGENGVERLELVLGGENRTADQPLKIGGLYPELAESRLARAHFWLSAPSAVLFPVGIYLAQTYQSHAVAIATSLLWLLGALVFFVVVAGVLFPRSSSAPVIRAGLRSRLLGGKGARHSGGKRRFLHLARSLRSEAQRLVREWKPK